VIKLPASQIVVEQSRPQVVVNETRVVHAKPHRIAAAPTFAVAPAPLALAPAPMVATIFTPMAMPAPMPPLSMAPCPPCPEQVKARTALDALHDLEYHSLEVRKIQAVNNIEMQHAQEALKRMSSQLQSSLSQGSLSAGNGDAVQTELRAQVARLTDLVNGSTDRTNQLEKVIKELQTLILAHDEVIKNKVLQGGGGPSCGGGSSDVQRLEAMIKEMQQLVLRHDDVLQEIVRQKRMAPGPMMPPAAPNK
jgi:hypothetical protein